MTRLQSARGRARIPRGPRPRRGRARGRFDRAQSSTARTLSISGAIRSNVPLAGTPIVAAVPARSASSSSQSSWSRRRASSSPEASSRSRANSRIVSSIQKRSSPSASVRRRTRLLSSRDASVSRSESQTASAASSVQPPRKTASRANSCLLVVVEQVVAPGDRGAQRGVALVGIAAALEQIEPLPDPLEQLLGAEQLDACRGELDREREPVEAADQLVHRGRVADIGADGPRPLDEQRDGVGLVHRRQVELGTRRRSAAARGSSPRSEAPARRRAARRAAGRRRAAAARGCRGRRGFASRRSASRSRRDLSPEAPRRSAISGTTSAGVANGSERYEDRATVGLLGQESGKLDREPCLARAARADDRQHARVAVEPQGGGLEELALASEELRRRSGQVDCARRPQRREIAATPSWNSRAGASKSLSR